MRVDEFIICFIFYQDQYYTSQMENSDSCQYLETTQYRASCKQGAMPILNQYRFQCWHGTDFQYQ